MHPLAIVRGILAAFLIACVAGVFLPVAFAQDQPPTPGPTVTDPISGPIRAADTIRVVVAGVEGQNLGGEFKIEQDGSVTLPRLGAFKAITRMPADVAMDIKKRIEEKKLLRKADVTVYITGRRKREVILNGAVGTQGVQPIKDGAMLAEAVELAVPKPDADLSKVEITRNDQKIIVNYLKYRNGISNATEFNPPLEDGDRIFIYGSTPIDGFVRVTGEIKDQTKVVIPLAQGGTVGQVLQLVGGITDFADRNGIVVERNGFRLFVPYDDIMKKVPGKDIPLMDKDILIIPRLERPRQFSVNGAVRQATSFPLTTRTTLLQAIAQAGGPVDGAQQNKVEVRRTDHQGKVTTKVYDLKKDTDATQEIADGDYVYVPFPKQRPRMDLPTVIGVISSVVFIYSMIK
jgi:protein involved in polysaccharide export with SLBB domain